MPRGVILAAPASGQGKTLTALSLLRAFQRTGRAVVGAKAGPDYIDPGYHAAASGRPSFNLDPWAMRPETTSAIVESIDADYILCEGVMGLFDGAGAKGDRGSTADLAAITGWPVVMVVDAQGQSASVAALLKGFANHRPDITLSGIILNRVGSDRHAGMLRSAIETHLPDLAVLGTIPRDNRLALPSRHLGLVLAGEQPDLDSFLTAAADVVEGSVNLDSLLALAKPHRAAIAAHNAVPPLGSRIAVAQDRAFAFIYPHLVEGWRRGGAEIIPFSPLADEAPDATADAVFLPGGYPELHAGRIAGAHRFMTGLRDAAAQGSIVYGECGGYMILGRSLIDADGAAHPMAGLLPIVTSMAKPKRHLGCRQGVCLHGPWSGQAMRGHEFHFAEIVESGAAQPLWSLCDADNQVLGDAGHAVGTVAGSFFHAIDCATD